MSLLNSLVSIFGTGRQQRNVHVIFWGTDNDEIATLSHLIKTGEYAFQNGSIFPVTHTINFGDVNLKLSIPSGNQGARARAIPDLPLYDGIICVTDLSTAESLEYSKAEIHFLARCLPRDKPPVLILGPKAIDERRAMDALGIHDIVMKDDVDAQPGNADRRRFKYFTYMMSDQECSGYQDGLRWLLEEIQNTSSE